MTWNPVRGCTRVSRGCGGPGNQGGCYAERVAARFSGPGLAFEGRATREGGKARWTGKLALAEDALLKPLRWRRPRRIFVNSMLDLFHENMPDEWIDRVFAVMALCPQHTFQVLTKRPERMRAYVTDAAKRDRVDVVMDDIAPAHWCRREIEDYGGWPIPNVWLGTSCEDQASADDRVPELLATPAAVRFISAEPLLGPIDFTRISLGLKPGVVLGEGRQPDRPQTSRVVRDALKGTSGACERLDWIITGGKSGPGARPIHPAWARSIRDQCATAEVAFFFKQHGEWLHEEQVRGDHHPGSRFFGLDGRPVDPAPPFGPATDRLWHWWEPDLMASFRIDKRAAGRLLDGVEHNAMPEVRHG